MQVPFFLALGLADGDGCIAAFDAGMAKEFGSSNGYEKPDPARRMEARILFSRHVSHVGVRIERAARV
jgi:hypothetical protein